MKGIIIRDCLNCPYSEIKNPCDNGGTLVCTLGKNFDWKMELIRKMISIDEKIPDWCCLDELQEMVNIAKYQYAIKYQK